MKNSGADSRNNRGELEEQRPSAATRIRTVAAMNRRRLVPNLLQNDLLSLKNWLRGHATSGTCSCGAERREVLRGRRFRCHAVLSAIDTSVLGIERMNATPASGEVRMSSRPTPRSWKAVG